MLLITVEFIRHSLLSKLFYQLLYGYLVISIFFDKSCKGDTSFPHR